TLYKHQLGLKRQRFRARSITLENAFSRSINPYFGKLGITYLARDEFGEMAHELFFNEPLEFDLPLRRSSCFVPESDFERAELASGFNTRTTISPLHAALIAALPVNGGKMMRPYVVKRIENESGNDIYCGESEVLAAPLSSYSITQLARLMQATVKKGTARKSFRHLRRYRDYSNWVLGGKTGAINMTEEQRRCEWYAGFAAKGDTRLSVAMVMVHGELRTVKPSYVAAELIKKCFTRKSVRTVSANKKKASSG
ncbi:MAG: hypothetical protein GY868_11420, partial [Deltaproteobacteria bacterium]|nr:hypothetical protein [Deltaproteobacteria bacterium]